jgi:FlgD Ig-like domain
LARLLPTIVVVALLAGTAAAFAVTEGLKLEKSPILDTRVDKLFSPRVGEARIAFRLRKADRVAVAIEDSDGKIVRTLLHRRFNAGFLNTAWNGRDEAGRVVPDGTYKPRVHLADQHRTIVLPNPIRLDSVDPRVTSLVVSPRFFSPDGDYRRDYLTIRYRLSEPARALLFVDRRFRTKVKFFRKQFGFTWNPSSLHLRPGAHQVTVAAQDRAGNQAAPSAPALVRVRYLELGRHVIRARAGQRFGVRVLTDAGNLRWRIGPRVGRVRGKRLVLLAGEPGRYTLVVFGRGHRDTALLLVRR